MKKFKKIIALASAVTLIAASFAACGGKEKEVAKDVDPNAPLTYWCTMDGNSSNAGLQSYSDMMLFKEMEKRTGVKVEFIHPIKGSTGSEAFLTVISSKERPDMMEYGWSSYTGGAQKAIEDEVIIALNDYMEEYAPNYYDYMEGEKGKANNYLYKLQTTSEDGYYYGFNVINVGTTRGFAGLYLRADKLREWNMAVPETIEEWEAVLAKAKADGFEKPFTCGAGAFGFTYQTTHSFNTAFGVGNSFYLEGDKVVFGPFEDGYKDYVALIADWVKKGYIDTSFPTADSAMINGNMTNGISFASWGYVGGSMGTILPAAKANNPEYDLVACPYPVAEKGQISEFQQLVDEANTNCTAITTSCATPEKAISWYDYFYSEEGMMLLNFGIEGESYEMINGYPTYTELITKNPNGKSMAAMLGQYARSATQAPFVQDRRYMEQYASLPQQKDAIEVWGNTDADKHILPPLAPSAEESSELAKILGDVNTHVEEYTTKFVAGQISFDDWDKYISQLKTLKIERAIEIYQNAYDVYSAK